MQSLLQQNSLLPSQQVPLSPGKLETWESLQPPPYLSKSNLKPLPSPLSFGFWIRFGSCGPVLLSLSQSKPPWAIAISSERRPLHSLLPSILFSVSYSSLLKMLIGIHPPPPPLHTHSRSSRKSFSDASCLSLLLSLLQTHRLVCSQKLVYSLHPKTCAYVVPPLRCAHHHSWLRQFHLEAVFPDRFSRNPSLGPDLPFLEQHHSLLSQLANLFGRLFI